MLYYIQIMTQRVAKSQRLHRLFYKFVFFLYFTVCLKDNHTFPYINDIFVIKRIIKAEKNKNKPYAKIYKHFNIIKIIFLLINQSKIKPKMLIYSKY